ncbi:MAG: RNA polymerase sigma factor [Planctomycetes bacterium]|nr:RNA polymerase sigma factor [Planctomycetota bacterium]
MSKLAVSTLEERTPKSDGAHMDTEEDFVCAFNSMRTELMSTLFFVLGNHDDAQDVAQEVFIKCWRTRDGLTDVKNLRAWIFRVGINAAKDLQRNAWRRKARPLGDASPPEIPGKALTPGESLENKETLERVRTALMELRPEEKEVFLLRQNGDLTYEEIASLRRTPIGTVKTQMRSALQKLRRVLKEP